MHLKVVKCVILVAPMLEKVFTISKAIRKGCSFFKLAYYCVNSYIGTIAISHFETCSLVNRVSVIKNSFFSDAQEVSCVISKKQMTVIKICRFI